MRVVRIATEPSAVYDCTDPYVELEWLPIIGPSAFVLWRRLAAGLDQWPDYEVDRDVLADALGIGGGRGTFAKTLSRLERFGFLRCWTDEQGEWVSVRTHLYPVPSSLAQRHAEHQRSKR